MPVFRKGQLRTLFAIGVMYGLPAVGQVQTAQQPLPSPIPGFCPAPHDKVDPPQVLTDDLCSAPAGNSFRLQEQAPLTFGQKADYFVQNQLFSASSLFGAAFFGGISQWRRDPPQWPQGAEGFGERIGTRYAQTLTENTAAFLFGFMEDPRTTPPPQYMVFKNGEWQPNSRVHGHGHGNRKFGVRLGYALLGVVWTHYDTGRDGIAFSRVGGAFASGLIGRVWTPDPTNTWAQVGVRTASALGGDAASAVFREFEPDLTKLLGRLAGRSKTPSVNGKSGNGPAPAPTPGANAQGAKQP